MRMLYIDESYDKEFISLAGVILPDNKYRKFMEDIENFISTIKYFPKDAEIHADHIWNYRNQFNDLLMPERAQLTQEIAQFISNAKLSKILIATHSLQQISKEEAYLILLQKIVNRGAQLTSKAGSSHKQLLLVFDERSDINQIIHTKLLEQRKLIAEKYSSACVFIDAGYEGKSKYSRLLQVADFVAYWSRISKTVASNPTLFKKEDDARKVKLVEQINASWKSKLINV